MALFVFVFASPSLVNYYRKVALLLKIHELYKRTRNMIDSGNDKTRVKELITMQNRNRTVPREWQLWTVLYLGQIAAQALCHLCQLHLKYFRARLFNQRTIMFYFYKKDFSFYIVHLSRRTIMCYFSKNVDTIHK